MRPGAAHFNRAADHVIAGLARDGKTFRQIADAARFAAIDAFVQSVDRRLRLPASGPWIAELRSDAASATQLGKLLLRQPFIGQKSLFACYLQVHRNASFRYYLEEDAPSTRAHGDERLARALAREDAEELAQFLKGLLP